MTIIVLYSTIPYRAEGMQNSNMKSNIIIADKTRNLRTRRRIEFILLILLFLSLSVFHIVRQIENKYLQIRNNNIGLFEDFDISDTDNNAQEYTYIPVSIDAFTLWADTAQDLSCYPKGLDLISLNQDGSCHYVSNVLGYSIDYPSYWNADNHAAPYYTRFFDSSFRLDITVQDVNDAWTDVDNYLKTTIDPIKDLITLDKNETRNSLMIRIIDYTRPLVTGIENDMNYYRYYFIIHEDYVYTMQLKTNEENFESKKSEINSIVNSFRVEKVQRFNLNQIIQSEDLSHDLIIKHDYKTLSIPRNTFMMGVFTPNSRDINKLEDSIGQPIGLQMLYKGVDSDYDAYTEELAFNNKLPVITFLFEEVGKKDNTKVMRNMINGKYDATLANWGKNIAGLKTPVLLRPGNEMNGNWTDWSAGYNYNDPDLYKLAFIHFVNVIKSAGADNAYFVWNPNHGSKPNYAWNNAAMFYPGDHIVDFVGLTYYNYGGGNYASFDELYRDYYWESCRAYYKKPLMIGEFGSVEKGGDKAEWIRRMFEVIPERYHNIKIAVWFDSKHSPRSSIDLRINTSKSSMKAFAEGMKKPKVIKRLINTQ